MCRSHSRSHRSHRLGASVERGQATIEYALVVMSFVIVMLVPVNVWNELIEAIKNVFKGFTYAISMSYPAVQLGSLGL